MREREREKDERESVCRESERERKCWKKRAEDLELKENHKRMQTCTATMGRGTTQRKLTGNTERVRTRNQSYCKHKKPLPEEGQEETRKSAQHNNPRTLSLSLPPSLYLSKHIRFYANFELLVLPSTQLRITNFAQFLLHLFYLSHSFVIFFLSKSHHHFFSPTFLPDSARRSNLLSTANTRSSRLLPAAAVANARTDVDLERGKTE